MSDQEEFGGYCKMCLVRLSYNNEFDAFYCKACDFWDYKGCNDPQCYFQCLERPNKPSECKE